MPAAGHRPLSADPEEFSCARPMNGVSELVGIGQDNGRRSSNQTFLPQHRAIVRYSRATTFTRPYRVAHHQDRDRAVLLLIGLHPAISGRGRTAFLRLSACAETRLAVAPARARIMRRVLESTATESARDLAEHAASPPGHPDLDFHRFFATKNPYRLRRASITR